MANILNIKDANGNWVTVPALKGDTGATGKDGTPCRHSWNGTTLTVTSASGTSSANLKGDTGAAGKDGRDGAPGVSGVYVGSGEPTDNSTVWINLDYVGDATTFNPMTVAQIKSICT